MKLLALIMSQKMFDSMTNPPMSLLALIMSCNVPTLYTHLRAHCFSKWSECQCLIGVSAISTAQVGALQITTDPRHDDAIVHFLFFQWWVGLGGKQPSSRPVGSYPLSRLALFGLLSPKCYNTKQITQHIVTHTKLHAHTRTQHNTQTPHT